MSVQSFELGFSSSSTTIEEALGIDISDSTRINLFDGEFDQPRTRIGDGGLADAVDGFFEFNFGVGLDIVFERATLGEIKVEYPISTEITLPDSIVAGGSFEVSTSPIVDVTGAQVTGESISLGNIGLDLNVSSTGAQIDELMFLEVFGEPLVDPDLGPINFEGFSEDVRLVEFDLSVGASTEIIDGVEVSISSPGGEENTGSAVASNNVSVLPSAGVEVIETLASISANPLEILDSIPALRPLDVLTEDFGPFDFSFFGEDYSLEATYTLLAPFISAGFGIVQSFEFIPSAINTVVEVGGESFEGLLGDSFDFSAPDTLDGELAGSITYDIDGSFAVSYRLAPVGSVGIEALGAEFVLEQDGVETSLGFGPLLEASVSGSTDFGSLEIFRSDPIDLPDDFFAPITQEFSIPTGRGQDIAFVIDTTGSMFDDIDAVKSSANSLINSIFDPERGLINSRIAVVGYNDPTTETILSFTDQADPEARKTAALNAINGISVGGGGDFPELTYTGLLRALDGRAGEWREDAVARKIVLFGDATAKDTSLASQVFALAANLNVDVSASEIEAGTFEIADGISLTTLDTKAVDPISNEETVLRVQIFTVAIGSNSGTISEFTDIAENAGGETFTAANASEIVDTLLEVINLPIYTIAVDQANIDEGDSGATTVTVTVNRDVTDNAATVEIAQGGTADAADTGAIATTLEFAVGDATQSFTFDILGDVELENDETIAFTISSVSESATFGASAAVVTIANDDVLLAPGIGTNGDDTLIGTADADTLTGFDGNDRLDGRADSDTLVGGDGDDQYFIDDVSDLVIENADEGYDRVHSSISFTLGDNVEAGAMRGAGDLSITGNTLDNWISGNSGANVLLGAAGNDRLIGYDGDDTLNGGIGNDVLEGRTGVDTFVFETGGGTDVILDFEVGVDKIDISDTRVLFFEIEITNGRFGTQVVVDEGVFGDIVIVLNGVDALSLTSGDFITRQPTGQNIVDGTPGDDTVRGTDLDEFLTGQSGDDILIGGLGDDTMIGGTGDDRYFIEQVGDAVVETANEGYDRVYGTIDFALSENVEAGYSRNNAAVSITGNSLDNWLSGGSANDQLIGEDGNDRLVGKAGDDTLNGGAGDDVLQGQAGADIFKFVRNDGTDVILDFEVGVDQISFVGSGLTFEDLSIVGSGANAIVHYDFDDRIVVSNIDAAGLTEDQFVFV